MMRLNLGTLGYPAAAIAAMAATAGQAQDAGVQQGATGDLEIIGAPSPGGIGFQPAATQIAESVHFLDGFINWILLAIVILVVGLLAAVAVKFNAKANPTPARFTHNSPLEIAWTVVPILVLVIIGAFSLPVLFFQQEMPEGDVRIRVTGYQWYWGYEYVDEGFGFDAFMLDRDELEDYGYGPDEYRLATNNAVVVPAGQDVVLEVVGGDVIHSWTIPAFGVKQDAIPGRVAELWFNSDREGIYFGQCSELCGVNHAYMPITVKVVSPEAYEAWLGQAQEEFASAPAADDYDVAAR